MRAELANSKLLRGNFLSRATVNLSWYDSTFSRIKLGREQVKQEILT